MRSPVAPSVSQRRVTKSRRQHTEAGQNMQQNLGPLTIFRRSTFKIFPSEDSGLASPSQDGVWVKDYFSISFCLPTLHNWVTSWKSMAELFLWLQRVWILISQCVPWSPSYRVFWTQEKANPHCFWLKLYSEWILWAVRIVSTALQLIYHIWQTAESCHCARWKPDICVIE